MLTSPAITTEQATSIKDFAAEIADIDAKIERLERFIDDLHGDIKLLEDERDEIQGQLDLFELELEDAP
jgi:chromosome segregation ATPase